MKRVYPKITVIIPTFNRANFLKESLDSILSQTLPATQIIVVNNGSTDDTAKMCRGYENKIEYYELDQIGKSGAVNFGLTKTTGEYVWIFDDDDVALTSALERLVEPLVNNTDYGFSYTTFFYASNNTANNRIGDIIRKSIIPNLEKGFLITLLENNFLAAGATLFVRTSCYQDIGNFDQNLLRSQDYEMTVRLARKFKGVSVEGGPTFYFRQHDGARGPIADRFVPTQIKEKWLKYDQIIFKKLYKELPLSDYLLPEDSFNEKIRQAILQRMLILASKGLFLEVLQDLQLLATLKDKTPFSKMEYSIVRAMIFNKPYYNNPPLFEYKTFFNEVSRLAMTSQVIRLFRFNLMWAIGARVKSQPKLNEIHKILNRLVHLNI